MIEPHAELLSKPINGTLLYKIIPAQYFFDMLEKKYLYFRRVDTYCDDKRDSDQPDKDKELTKGIKFEKSPQYTVQQYYSDTRSKTYACCFSTENTQYLWDHYDNQESNSICLVFDCEKLMKHLNSKYENAKLIVDNKEYFNFFFINYGLVTYGNFDEAYINKELLTPIKYAYFKDASKYSEEKEFRISLSCIGRYKVGDYEFDFPESIQLEFDLSEAVKLGVVKNIIISEKYENDFVEETKRRANLCGVTWVFDKQENR
jgi:hypothetical protein